MPRANACGYVRLWHEGKDRQFGAFPNKTEARLFYEKAKLEQKEGRFFPERYQRAGHELMEAVIARYLTTATHKRAYQDDLFFATWWKQWFQGERLNAITPARIEEARQHLLGQGRTPGRVNRYHAWLRHVLNVVIRDGKLLSNPATKIKMYKESKGRTRYLSPKEEAQLLTHLGPRHGPYARFAILTGLRQQEQLRLQWKDVDQERGFLTLRQTKAGEVQYVPLNQEALGILRSLDSWQHSKWVFPSQNPAQPLDRCNFMNRYYRKAVREAGIEWATWHDLRHTFASRLAMRGVPLQTIAALLRHSTTNLVKRYAHLSPSYLKDAAEEVSVYGQDEKDHHQRAVIEPVSDGTVTKSGTEEKPQVKVDV